MPITTKQFRAATGRDPDMDDLERCNCPDAGTVNHMSCGWDTEHDLPRFLAMGKGDPRSIGKPGHLPMLESQVALEAAKWVDWFRQHHPQALPVPGTEQPRYEWQATEKVAWNHGYLMALHDLLPLVMGINSPAFGKRQP